MNTFEDPTKIGLWTDPLARRFTGVTNHKRMYFDVPFISHVTGNLYVGGCQMGLVLPEQIEHVISLYPWERYEILHEVKSYQEIKMYDALDQGMEQVEEIAGIVRERMADGPTLVHCQAGLNRSNLVAGVALIQDGMKPAEVLALLRKRSPAVLCNETFEEYILNHA